MDRRTGSGGQEAACRVSPRADHCGLARRAQPEAPGCCRGPGGPSTARDTGTAQGRCCGLGRLGLHSPAGPALTRHPAEAARGLPVTVCGKENASHLRAKMDSETSFCSSSFSQTNLRGRRGGCPASSQGPSPRLPHPGGQRPRGSLRAPRGGRPQAAGPRRGVMEGSSDTQGSSTFAWHFGASASQVKLFLSQEQ